MSTNVLIQIDDALKTETATVLAEMGLTISDAIRLMLTKIAYEHKLPFEPFMPNGNIFVIVMCAPIWF